MGNWTCGTVVSWSGPTLKRQESLDLLSARGVRYMLPVTRDPRTRLQATAGFRGRQNKCWQVRGGTLGDNTIGIGGNHRNWGVSQMGCRHVTSILAVWRLSQLSGVSRSPASVVRVSQAASQMVVTSERLHPRLAYLAGVSASLGRGCRHLVSLGRGCRHLASLAGVGTHGRPGWTLGALSS